MSRFVRLDINCRKSLRWIKGINVISALLLLTTRCWLSGAMHTCGTCDQAPAQVGCSQ